jgi:PAS domain S-box-containing protein
MKMLHRLSDLPIKRKLLLGTLAICIAALGLACTALFWFQSVTFRKGFAAELESLGAIIAHNSAAPLAFDDKKSAIEVLAALKVKPHITSASVFDGDGKLFANWGAEKPAPEAAHQRKAPGVTFDQGYARISLPIRLEDARSGRLELRALFADQYRELLSLYALVLIAVLIGSLVVIFLLSSALQRLITNPIIALADVARNISEKEDYSVRAREFGRDEVGLLTRTFNRMLEQIQSRDTRLQESQQRYEVAVLGSSDGLWDWDLVTNAVYLSPRWKSMLGYADAELENSFDTFRGLLHPADVQPVLGRVESYLEGRESSYEVEFRARHQDGSYRWILSRGVALRNEQGKRVRFAGSHTDITARKRAEEEIRLAREKFESLVHSLHGIVWEADPATFEMTFISDQVETMLGYPARRWLEEPQFWENSIHPDDRIPTIEACKRGIAGGKPYQLEFRSIAADGRTVWLRESISVELEGDRPMRVRGVAIDITEQKLAAAQIARMQRELVDASRLAGMAEVATGVLHNVGNVLNSVNVSASLLLEGLRQSKAPALARTVALLREHQDHLAEFLSSDPKGQKLPGFLEALSNHFSSEQTKLIQEIQGLQQNVGHIKEIVVRQQAYAKVSGALENLAPHELIEDALRMSSTALARHQIEVVRQFDAVPAVFVDRHKVLQILVNLVNNARQALEERTKGRQILLRINRGEGERVRVEVTDNGIGIAHENLARIFSHGFTTKKTGHGFGLHSGANAARELGGSLTAYSAGPGQGATFVLELPTEDSLSTL